MLRPFLIIGLTTVLTANSILPVFAKEVKIDIDPVCCVKEYQVYGDEQLEDVKDCSSRIFSACMKDRANKDLPRSVRERTCANEANEECRPKNEGCQVIVDLDPFLTDEELQDIKEEALDAAVEEELEKVKREEEAIIRKNAERVENQVRSELEQEYAAELQSLQSANDQQSIDRIFEIAETIQERIDEDPRVVEARSKLPGSDFLSQGVQNLGQGLLGTVTGPVASLSSPFVALFQQSNVKKVFVSLLNSVFKGHTEKYHAFLDEEIFGKSIALISGYENSDELEDLLKKQSGECAENEDEPYPKPNCVAERALCSYEKYVGVLFEQSGQSLASSALDVQDTGTLFALLQERDQALLKEAQDTQQAFDTALAVYSQFFQTYRLHLRFKELIVYLARVRNLTGELRTLVGCIPNKFVGVATTKCN